MSPGPDREQILPSYLAYGFTTLIDLVSTPQALARWKSHDLVPDTYFCGAAALLDGYPMNYAPMPASGPGLAVSVDRARGQRDMRLRAK